MRKLFLILTNTLAFTFLVTLTYGQMINIECMNGEEICQGYLPQNQAHVMINSMPMSIPDNTYVTYRWTSAHANGSKVWDTNRPDRRIPVPWTGEYTVQVQVQFTTKGNSRPYAVFWSTPIKVMGKICKP